MEEIFNFSEASGGTSLHDEEKPIADDKPGTLESVGGINIGSLFIIVHQTDGSTPAGGGGYIAATGGGAIGVPEIGPTQDVCEVALDAEDITDHNKRERIVITLVSGCCTIHGANAANAGQLDYCPLGTNSKDDARTAVVAARLRACDTVSCGATGTTKGKKFLAGKTANCAVVDTAEDGAKFVAGTGTDKLSTAHIA